MPPAGRGCGLGAVAAFGWKMAVPGPPAGTATTALAAGGNRGSCFKAVWI